MLKIFHFGRFDMAVLKHTFGVMPRPIYCTKIASRIARTFTDRHGLKDLCRELLGIELSKQQQSSDWGAAELTQDQLNYAASDVLYLHALKEKLDAMLVREGREHLARACFAFLPTRVELDLARLGRYRPVCPLGPRPAGSRSAPKAFRSQCDQSLAAMCQEGQVWPRRGASRDV